MWKKRLSDDDAAALRADMRAGLEAAKIHGVRFPFKTLVDRVEMSQPFIHNIMTGKANGTLPTSVKIRDALRAMLAEAPGGDATTRALAIALAPATADARPALPPGRQRRSPSEETVTRKRANYEAMLAEQAPVRAQLVAYKQARGLSQRELAREIGLGESAMSYFFSGKGMKPDRYRKVLRFIARQGIRAAKPKAPASTALATRRTALDNNGRVIAVAAAMHPIHRVQPAPVSGPNGTAQQIAKDFVQKLLGGTLGIEAIEALIQIAKTNNE